MKRVYANQAVCIGCHLCEVNCQMAHTGLKDPAKAFRRGRSAPLPYVRVEVSRPVSFPAHCRHCEEPACVYACLVGAMQKDAVTGVVRVDPARCIGCWTCVLACPYGAVVQDTRRQKAVKCDLCGGKDPACVANCPNEALVYAEVQGDSDSGKAMR
ncbi:MAG: 4Fe-4S dicluster domain-containing protein [Chloroflexota bacterium]